MRRRRGELVDAGDDTIPEAFRRAMEEIGWGSDMDDPPTQPVEFNLGCLWRILPLIALVILLGSVGWIVTTYTDWLWFTELGYESVWLKRWGLQIGSFLLFFLVASLFLAVNWHLAFRQSHASAETPFLVPRRQAGWLVTLAALVVGYLFGNAGSAMWERLLRWYYAVPFGQADPIFNRDISFYLFELPLYRELQGQIMGLLFVAIIGVVALYALRDWSAVQERPSSLFSAASLRRHLAVLGTLFLLLWAVGYWLDAYELLLSSSGVVFGAGYTDVNATLLALRLQMVLMVIVALAVGANAVVNRLRWPMIAGGVWLAATLLVAGIYPSLVQRYQVEPNELAREEPFIANNIAMTRLAFGLDKIQRQPFTVDQGVTAESLEANDAILQNIRLWDYRPLLQTYNQLQALRPYYSFVEVDIDRYPIDGIPRQVMLAGRELDQSGVPNPTWINQQLQYTHGYGVVMNPVDEISPEGLPEFFVRDLPPVSEVPIEITRPELYYGELTTNEVFVNSGAEEFDYPSGDENVYTRYEGTGGVAVDSFLKRFAFATRFGELNVLLSEYITPETRAMYHRTIRERVQRITPFLVLDEDPYLVVRDDGSLVWILDTYTVSRSFPYSTPVADRPYNYIRNAAKVVINAYDGDVTYYVTAPEDPLVQTYDRAFPDLFQPLEAMPDDLLAHIRYPEDLFEVQSRQYLSYHMQDVQVFYNQEDLWDIPLELSSETEQVPVEPYYVISSLPGGDDPEFLLIRPYVPYGKNNMVSWMAARNDQPSYGELVVYELPKQELVFGPLQIDSRIDQEPSISEQISLWNQAGSRVLRGNLLVIPIGNSFLYVEPLYLQSAASALPELKRVIVASGNRIVMRETLTEALSALVEQAPAVDVIVADPGLATVDEPVAETPTDDAPVDQPTAPPAGDPVQPPAPDASIETLVLSANQRLQAAEAAQQRGDWAAYGSELEALQQELERLLELTGGTLPSEGTSGAP